MSVFDRLMCAAIITGLFVLVGWLSLPGHGGQA